MNLNSSDSSNEHMTLSPTTVAFFMTLLAFLSPFVFALNLLEGRIELHAVLWGIADLGGGTIVLIFPMTGMTFFAFILLRLVFVHQMYRSYQALVTRRRAILFGVLNELQLVILALILYPPAFGTPYINHVPIFGPLPQLLLFGIVLMYVFPPPAPPSQWIEKAIETAGPTWKE